MRRWPRAAFGAVCVGATCVRWDGLINERMLGFYDDTYIISQRELVEVIHHNDALAGIQLFYGGLIPGVGATFPLEPGKGWIPGYRRLGAERQISDRQPAARRVSPPRTTRSWSKPTPRPRAARARRATIMSRSTSATARCRM